MPHIRIFAAAIALGLASILVLGRLPMLDPHVQELRRETAVTAPYRPLALSDDNLADAAAGFALQSRLIRIGWDHSILTVDLALRQGADRPEDLWGDIVFLLRFAFAEAGNVRQVLIRVYRDPDERKTLLFYGDPRRENWTADRLNGLRLPDPGTNGTMLEELSLKATPAGERWLRNFANS